MALNFGTQGAVIVFAIAGVLNNIAFCQSGFKLLFGQKMVVFTVHFPFAHGAGGGGNGLFDFWVAAQQLCHNGILAGAGRPGDNKQIFFAFHAKSP